MPCNVCVAVFADKAKETSKQWHATTVTRHLCRVRQVKVPIRAIQSNTEPRTVSLEAGITTSVPTIIPQHLKCYLTTPPGAHRCSKITNNRRQATLRPVPLPDCCLRILRGFVERERYSRTPFSNRTAFVCKCMGANAPILIGILGVLHLGQHLQLWLLRIRVS